MPIYRQHDGRVAVVGVVLLLCCHCDVPSAMASSSESAAQAHAHALTLAQQGDYRGAIPFFVSATRLGPTPAFWNNLGVTHMRIAEFGPARDAFIRGLAMTPGHGDCTDNLRDLDTHLTTHGHTLTSVTGLSQYAVDTAAFHDTAAAVTPGYARDAGYWAKKLAGGGGGTDQQSTPGAFAVAAAGPGAAKRTRARMPREQMQHSVEYLPRIPVSQLYSRQENARYARGAVPFIVTGIADSPAWTGRNNNAMRLWDVDFLARSFPEVTADFYPHNMGEVRVKPFLVPMATAVAELKAPSGAYPAAPDGSGGRYLQWNVNAPDWRRLQRFLGPLPPLFESDAVWLEHEQCLGSAWAPNGTAASPSGGLPPGSTQLTDGETLRSEFFRHTHWRMLIVGNEGAGMFHHSDILLTGSWQLQVRGAKTWHLCSPDQAHLLYGAGEVDTLNPDYAARPYFKHARCFLDTVRAGEALYYPRCVCMRVEAGLYEAVGGGMRGVWLVRLVRCRFPQ